MNKTKVKNLQKAYASLQDTVRRALDSRTWYITDSCLSVFAAMLLSDIGNPLGLNLVGAPSCGKSTVLSFFEAEPKAKRSLMARLVHKVDYMTPRAFVSHMLNVSEKDLRKIDLLQRIRFKVVIIPDLSPVFSKRADDLGELMGILTRVFDGQGYKSHSGARGERGYSGDYFFCWLGATTPLDSKTWRVMSRLGTRMLFLNVPEESDSAIAREKIFWNLTGKMSMKEKVDQCRKGVRNYLNKLFERRAAIRRIKWDRNPAKEAEPLLFEIGLIARFVAQGRGVIHVNRDAGSSFVEPVCEGPARLTKMLYDLARGHAILQGNMEITEPDIRLAFDAGMGSMPSNRRRVLTSLLLKGRISTRDVQKVLRTSTPTAHKTMELLELLELAEFRAGQGRNPATLELVKEFRSLSEIARSSDSALKETCK